jgi:methionyl-tRNA formyltransferase
MPHVARPEEGTREPAGGPRVLYLGMPGAFSLAPLAALLDAGAPVCAVLVPAAAPGAPALRARPPVRAARAGLPLLTVYRETSVVSLAWERGIPLLEAAREGAAESLAQMAALAPDVACVACWPRRLPGALLRLPRLGSLNLHPSLLPAHRGPAPLFWTLRAGDARAGVTVHEMDERLDGGAILAQEALDLPDGIDGAALERRCADAGGRLLARTVRALAEGRAERRPQDPDAGGYEPWPAPADFVVTPDRPARWAFNFIRGAAYWGGPPELRIGAERFAVAEALGYAPEATLGAPYRRAGAEIWVQYTPGVLHALLAP